MKKHSSLHLIFTFFLTAILIYLGGSPPAVMSAGGVPSIISYQGRLADSAGNLLGSSSGTTYFFAFSIWDNATVGSGTKLWPVATTSVPTTVKSGVFNVNIGDTAGGYPDTLNYTFTSPNIFLQVDVSSNGTTWETVSPRQRLSSAVFAQVAEAVVGASSTVTTLTNTNFYGTFATTTSATTTNLFANFLNSATVTASGLGTFGNFLALGSTTLQNFTALNSTTTNATTTNIYVNGKLYGANLTNCNSNADKLLWANGLFSCGTDGGGGGSDVDWLFFNNTGIRLGTTTNQVLIGFNATSSLAMLELNVQAGKIPLFIGSSTELFKIDDYGLVSAKNLLLDSSTTLQNFTFVSATGSQATTTNLFTNTLFSTTASSTNLFANTATFGTLVAASFNPANITTGNLLVTGSSTLQNFTFINATGSQATTTNFFSTGIFSTILNNSGLATLGNILSSGSSTLQNFTFINATGTSATTTNFFSINASTTNLWANVISSGLINGQTITSAANFTGTLNATGGLTTLSNLLVAGSSTLQNFTFANATGSQATTTYFFSTNLFGTNGNLTNLIFSLATGTSATTTNFFSTTASSTNLFATTLNTGNITSTALATLANLLVSGSSTLQNFTFVNATGSQATTTNLFSANLFGTTGFLTNLQLNGSSTLQNFTFSNATGTSATTTNFFATNASTTNLWANIISSGLINGQNITSAANFTGTLNATGGLTTLSNLLISGSSTLQNFTFVNATGTSASTTNFFAINASTSNLFANSLTVGNITSIQETITNLLALGSSTLQNFTGLNSTTTNATTTRLAIISLNCGTFTNNGKLTTNADGTVSCSDDIAATQDVDWIFFNNTGVRLATTTNQVLIGASATSSLANLEISFQTAAKGSLLTLGSSTLQNFTFITATGTAATTTNFFGTNIFSTILNNSGLATLGNLLVLGSSTLQDFTFVNATGSQATTTSLFSANVFGTNANLTNLIFSLATGTSATTTNLFSGISSSTNLFSSVLTVGSNALLVNSSGFVGIATTSPFARLSVMLNAGDTNTTVFAIGSTTATGFTNLLRVDNQGSTTVKTLRFDDTGANNLFWTIREESGNNLEIFYPSIRRGVFVNAGNGGFLGIGTTSMQGFSSFIVASATPTMEIMDNNGPVDLKHWLISADAGKFFIGRATDDLLSTTTYFFVDGNMGGNIGLNEASPNFRLEATGTSGSGYFGITNASDGDVFSIISTGNVGVNDATPDFKFESNGSNASGYFGITNSSDGDIFAIDGSGEVGIGIVNPSYALHIVDDTNETLAIETIHTTGTSLVIKNTSGGGHSFSLTSTGSDGSPGNFVIRDNTANFTGFDLAGATGNLQITRDAYFGWSSNASDAKVAADTILSRISAGVVGTANLILSGNSTTSQATTTNFFSATIFSDLLNNSGLATLGNMLVLGSSTLQNFTFGNATGSQATTTNLFSTKGSFTTICFTGDVCRTSWPSTGGGGGSDTNWQFFNNSGIRLATTTNQVLIGASATTSLANLEIAFQTAAGGSLYALGSTTLNNFAFANSTGSQATTTNLFSTNIFSTTGNVSGTQTAGNLLALGSSTLQNFTFRNATGSDATTTNFRVSNRANIVDLTVGSIEGLNSASFNVTDDASGIFEVNSASVGDVFTVNDFGTPYFSRNLGLGTSTPSANLTIQDPNPEINFYESNNFAKTRLVQLGDSEFDIVMYDGSGVVTNALNMNFNGENEYLSGMSGTLGSNASARHVFYISQSEVGGFDYRGLFSIGSTKTSGGTAVAALDVTGNGYISGKLGVGTTTPYAGLQIATSTRPQLILTDILAGPNVKHFYASSTNGRLAIGNLSDNLGSFTDIMDLSSTAINFTLGSEENKSFNIKDGPGLTTLFSVDNDTKTVGIGTTTPGAKLEVAKTSSGATSDALFLSNQASATNTATRLSFRAQDIKNIATTTASIVGLLGKNFDQATSTLIFSTQNAGTLTEQMRLTDTGLLLIGSTTLQNFTFRNATGTSATTTNFFATNASTTNFFANVISSGLINGQTISSAANFTGTLNVTSGQTTVSNLLATGSSTLQNFTFVNATGTSATTTNFFATNASTTNLFYANAVGGAETLSGLLTAANIRSNGSSTLQNFTFVNATGSQATTTNLFSTNLFGTTGNFSGLLTLGNLLLTGSSTFLNLTFVNATGTSATTTNLFATTLFSTTHNNSGLITTGNLLASGSSTLQSFTAINSTTSQATSTNFFSTNIFGTTGNISGLSTFGNLLVSGSSTLQNLTFSNATGSQATTTNIFSTNIFGTTGNVSGLATLGNLLVSGSSTLQNFTFVNATGTSATTTNFFATNASTTNLFFTTSRGGSETLTATLTANNLLANASSTLQNFTFVNATGSQATTTNLFATNLFGTTGNISGTQTVGNLLSLGSSTLQNFTFSNATGTSATTTNFFATNASTTNFWANVISSGLINGQTITSAANFTGTLNVTSGQTTLSNLLVTGSSTLQNFTFINATGSQATTTNLFATTLFSTTHNNSGLGIFGNILSLGSSTLQNFTFANATGSQATTTSLFATKADFTTLCIAQDCKTAWPTSGGASTDKFATSTNGLAIYPNSAAAVVIGGSATTTTGAELEVLGDIYVSGSSTLQNFTFINATGTSATTTNLFSTTASSTNLFATAIQAGTATFNNILGNSSSTLQNFTFVNATGTSATTTNFFATNASTTNFFFTTSNGGNETLTARTSHSSTPLAPRLRPVTYSVRIYLVPPAICLDS
ncbi:hypothetical protein KW796_01460 [Candidatus Parcubacteria bacterium]|nr:hypothetical protein [Candidatus Parcubacteria bacterium]